MSRVIHNPIYWAERKTFERELELLFKKRNRSNGQTRNRLEEELNGKVEAWNVRFLKKERLFDLHFMTTEAAVDFVRRMTERMDNRGEFELITGRGRHSRDHVARIKERLLEEYKEKRRCDIREIPGNPGRLKLDMW